MYAVVSRRHSSTMAPSPTAHSATMKPTETRGTGASPREMTASIVMKAKSTDAAIRAQPLAR